MGLREELDARLGAIETDVGAIDGPLQSALALLEQLSAERADAIKTGDIERIKAVDEAIAAKMQAFAQAVATYTPLQPSGNAPA